MSRLRAIAGLLISVLREIFDEGAYARFLQRNGMSESRSSYAGFEREQQAVQERRVKCC